MKRLLMACALFALPAVAADTEATCAAEGGCLIVTQKAWDYLIQQIMLRDAQIERMKKEQCA